MSLRKCVVSMTVLLSLSGVFSPQIFASTLSNQLGLVFYNPRESDPVQLTAIFKHIHDDGFKRIEIPYWGCQPNATSNEVGSCVANSAPVIISQAKIAKAQGLAVTFLPIVTTLDGVWRGYFQPTDYARWFQTYGAWMEQVAHDAVSLGMTDLVVATEFSTPIFNQTDQWINLLKALKKVFPGKLIVTVNWDQPDFGFWSAADVFGISAYFPLDNGFYPLISLQTVANQNRETMKQKAAKAGKPLYITEFGYPEFVSAAAEPWQVPAPNTPQDLQLQSQCFDAFLQAWVGQDVTAINAWATSDPTLGMAPYEMLGTPAESVLKKYLQPR